MAKTSEVLGRAADIIERVGWIQGNYGMLADQDTPKCITGGLACAMDLEPVGQVDPSVDGPIYGYGAIEITPAHRALQRHLHPDPVGDGELWQWNDLATTTKERVIEVLRAAAIIEAAREQEKKGRAA